MTDQPGNTRTQLDDNAFPSELSVPDLELTQYTSAAHEFGHVLGYFINKAYQENPGAAVEDHPNITGFDSHAYNHEIGFIMLPGNRGNPELRRVHAIEYKRLNGGAGLYMSKTGSIPIGNHFNKSSTLIRGKM